MVIMTHAKLHFNQLMLTLIFGIRATELPPPRIWQTTEKAGPNRVNGRSTNEEFLAMQRDGRRVERWWFTTKGKQILKRLHSHEAKTFCHSNRWSEEFCRQNSIALRRKTHTAQQSPAQLPTAIGGFHAKDLRQRKRGTYQFTDLENIDQISLPFVLEDNKTYEIQGAALKRFGLPLVNLD